MTLRWEIGLIFLRTGCFGIGLGHCGCREHGTPAGGGERTRNVQAGLEHIYCVSRRTCFGLLYRLQSMFYHRPSTRT